jgi:hypothetical protein
MSGYSGTVHFTSTDAQAELPADVVLNNGTGTFSATLKTAGPSTISATDTAISALTGTSGTIAVSAVAATHFTVTAPTSATSGIPFSFTVTALDQFNNTATSYAGTVHFTSSDGTAALPADATLTGGTGTFSATLQTAGDQTITATDTVTSSITGTSNTSVGQPGMSFSFVVSDIDKQVYRLGLDANGSASSSGWQLVAPGQFLSVTGGTYGSTRAPIVFGVGVDHRVYGAKFDASGNLLSGWSMVAPGLFTSVVVGNYGSGGEPIVFGIGTPGTGQKVWAARFDAQGDFRSGWGPVAPGVFTSLAVGTFGSGNSALFGLSRNQAFVARFDDNGLFTDGWVPVGPGQFQSLAAANRADGTLELFGAGLDGQAYAATFSTAGLRTLGWFPVNSGQPVGFTQLTAAPLANGNLAAFSLGGDQHAYEATFDAATGNELSGWAQVSTMTFARLAAAGQSSRTTLYGLGAADHQVYVEQFDAAGGVQSDFALLAPGQFTEVAAAG